MSPMQSSTWATQETSSATDAPPAAPGQSLAAAFPTNWTWWQSFLSCAELWLRCHLISLSFVKPPM